jgi:4-hydroxy-tetrahydrodipicolinate reductase
LTGTRISVVQYGLGPIGLSIARLVHEKPGLRLVGGIDLSPDLAGKALEEILGLNGQLDLLVSADADAVLESTRPDVVVLATSSSLDGVADQVARCAQAGANVVSTCEELVYPSERNRVRWTGLDQVAKLAGVTVLGTGVNPGFVMDSLPLFMSAVTERIHSVRVHRRQDASKRRLSLQKKIGVGLSPEAFRTLATQGGLGHIGLRESALMVAERLGFRLDAIVEDLQPLIADHVQEHVTPPVEPGMVAGIHQTAIGVADGAEKVVLVLDMSVDVDESTDEIHIAGDPSVDLILSGGLHGDVATRAIVVNSIPVVLSATPGLVTMADLPAPAALAAV